MKHLHLLSCSSKNEKVKQPLPFTPQVMKKRELILLKNDWLKEEHWIKINSWSAKLEYNFIVLAPLTGPATVSAFLSSVLCKGGRFLSIKGNIHEYLSVPVS